MFPNILSQEQLWCIGILNIFSEDFYLAGWTAIALQIGHRKSIDFDLFSPREIKNSTILNQLSQAGYVIDRILVDNRGWELTLIIRWVKITFLYYPFDISSEVAFWKINMPNLSILGAMKFYTLGRRGKWKDYVDIFFLFRSGYTLAGLSKNADAIFGGSYNEKLLREQLCYFDDIDYTEQVEYCQDYPNDEVIQKELCKIAIMH